MIFTTFTINAMEKNICPLALLPPEIHAHIARYLSFNNESDDEFIARTRKCGTLSSEHTALVENADMATAHSAFDFLRAYSVDCSKIISVKKCDHKPRVTIFDIHNKKTIRESENLAQLSKKNISKLMLIALSRTGTYYAQWQVHERDDHWKKPYHYQESRLIIKNVLSGKVEFLRYLITEKRNDLISMGFNKQGTKIIVHAKEDCIWEHPAPHKMHPYYIFLLTTPTEHEEKSKRTLEAYLRYIGCCKKLANSLPSLP